MTDKNPLIFYNILLFSLLCFFIPSVYNFMFNYSIGRVIIIILIAYFTKINFYVGLIFITIIIIMSSSLYEGFTIGQSAIVTTNYNVEENERKDPQEVFSYFRDFYCSPSNKNTPDGNKMSKWNNLANTSKDQNVVAVAKYNIERANAICSSASIPVPDKDLEWNTSNAQIPNKCMGGWTYIGGACYGPPGARCSPYSWSGMRGYGPGSVNAWASICGVNNTNVAIANAEKIRNAENSCGSGGTSTLFSIDNPSIPTLSVSNFPSLAAMTNWEMNVEFICNGGSNSWRALIGDMYNGSSWRGWGLWVSSSNGIHWSWASSTWDAPGFVVENGVRYNVNVTRNDSILTVTLTNLKSNNKKVASTTYRDRMTYGPVTIGGWISYGGERFPGKIYSINVKKTDRNAGSNSISSRIFNKPSCLLNNMESICSSIKNIDPQISNVLNPSITVGVDKTFEQDAQWLKNTYRDFCVKPQTGIGPLLR
jgi:hypothetical protein